MVAQLWSTTLTGLEARFVRVEVDLSPGLPGFHVVGLPDAAVAESVHRVRTALRGVGAPLPPRRCTVNLAPGDLRKEGARFDLAIALGILAAQNQLPPEVLEEVVVLGELSLDGQLRPVRGVLNTALAMRQRGLRRVLIPSANAREVAGQEALEVWPVSSLGQALEWLRGDRPSEVTRLPRPTAVLAETQPGEWDLQRVAGQELGRRALEVAAAGGHHLLWVGPPGCGKTLLSRCLPGILPPPSPDQSLEVACIQSALGGTGEVPICEPHCHISAAALLGGALPGEVSRAHHGVLFLDELPEFARDCLEGLRTALESGYVEVGRARTRWRYPAKFQLVAACNPCPCGYFGEQRRGCQCTLARRRAYLGRLSGPVRDRLDLQVRLQPASPEQAWERVDHESSREVARRVARARERQLERGGLNRDLKREYFLESPEVAPGVLDLICDYANRSQLSLRAMERVLRVSRTIADLEGTAMLKREHVAEAIHYRCLDRFEAS